MNKDKLLPIGSKFKHCESELTVVSHQRSNGYDLVIDGLLCHYIDNKGEICEIFFGPYCSEYLEYLHNNVSTI